MIHTLHAQCATCRGRGSLYANGQPVRLCLVCDTSGLVSVAVPAVRLVVDNTNHSRASVDTPHPAGPSAPEQAASVAGA